MDEATQRKVYDSQRRDEFGRIPEGPPRESDLQGRARQQELQAQGKLWQPYVGQSGRAQGRRGWVNAVSGRVIWSPPPAAVESPHTADQAQAVLANLTASGPLTPEKVRVAATVLGNMKTADLKALKSKLGIAAGGNRRAMADRILQVMGRGPTTSPQSHGAGGAPVRTPPPAAGAPAPPPPTTPGQKPNTVTVRVDPQAGVSGRATFKQRLQRHIEKRVQAAVEKALKAAGIDVPRPVTPPEEKPAASPQEKPQAPGEDAPSPPVPPGQPAAPEEKKSATVADFREPEKTPEPPKATALTSSGLEKEEIGRVVGAHLRATGSHETAPSDVLDFLARVEQSVSPEDFSSPKRFWDKVTETSKKFVEEYKARGTSPAEAKKMEQRAKAANAAAVQLKLIHPPKGETLKGKALDREAKEVEAKSGGRVSVPLAKKVYKAVTSLPPSAFASKDTRAKAIRKAQIDSGIPQQQFDDALRQLRRTKAVNFDDLKPEGPARTMTAEQLAKRAKTPGERIEGKQEAGLGRLMKKVAGAKPSVPPEREGPRKIFIRSEHGDFASLGEELKARNERGSLHPEVLAELKTRLAQAQSHQELEQFAKGFGAEGYNPQGRDVDFMAEVVHELVRRKRKWLTDEDVIKHVGGASELDDDLARFKDASAGSVINFHREQFNKHAQRLKKAKEGAAPFMKQPTSPKDMNALTRHGVWELDPDDGQDKKHLQAIEAHLDKVQADHDQALRNYADASSGALEILAEEHIGGTAPVHLEDGLPPQAPSWMKPLPEDTPPEFKRQLDKFLALAGRLVKTHSPIHLHLAVKDDLHGFAYDSKNKAILMGPSVWGEASAKSPTRYLRSLMHEFGHAVEHQVPGVHQAVKAYLEHRAKGARSFDLAEAHAPASKLQKGSRKVRDAGFKLFDEDHRNHYMAADRPKSTEVLSSAFESLVTDPENLAEREPELFKLILGVLRGDIRGA